MELVGTILTDSQKQERRGLIQPDTNMSESAIRRGLKLLGIGRVTVEWLRDNLWKLRPVPLDFKSLKIWTGAK